MGPPRATAFATTNAASACPRTVFPTWTCMRRLQAPSQRGRRGRGYRKLLAQMLIPAAVVLIPDATALPVEFMATCGRKGRPGAGFQHGGRAPAACGEAVGDDLWRVAVDWYHTGDRRCRCRPGRSAAARHPRHRRFRSRPPAQPTPGVKRWPRCCSGPVPWAQTTDGVAEVANLVEEESPARGSLHLAPVVLQGASESAL